METESMSEKRFEEMVAAFIKTNVAAFVEKRDGEILRAHEKRGIDTSIDTSTEVSDEMSKEVDEELLRWMTDELRSLFNEIINEDELFLGAIGYLAKRYEEAIKKLKSESNKGNIKKIRKLALIDFLGDLNLGIYPEVFLDDYIELIEEAIKKLKFEFEVI